MRLLRTDIDFENGELDIVLFHQGLVPEYAILSHTWLADSSQELTLQDVQAGRGRTRLGFEKVLKAIMLARGDDLDWIWIDTCCIDKTSSVELSEAINSMYRYYSEAATCYVFLADVSAQNVGVDFGQSRWFRRGWTLQEMLAPRDLIFLSREWEHVGTKRSMGPRISSITGVDEAHLHGGSSIMHASIAKRMSWASNREVTRAEDIAYCLIGIFGVNMFMLYGEGAERAFGRLQEEILRTSEDQSIFAWSKSPGYGNGLHGLLADSPKDFARAGSIRPYTSVPKYNSPVTMTAKGLHLSLPLTRTNKDLTIATLNCPVPSRDNEDYVAIYLTQHSTAANTFARVSCDKEAYTDRRGKPETFFVVQNIPDDIVDDVCPIHVFAMGKLFVHTEVPELRDHSIDLTYLKRWRAIQDDPDVQAQKCNWSKVPNTHRIIKRAGALTAASRITRSADGVSFVLLMGAMTDFSVGFDVSEDVPPAESNTWAEEQWQAYWQARFHPEAPGTCFPVDKPFVRITTRDFVQDHVKWFLVDVEIDTIVPESRSDASTDETDIEKLGPKKTLTLPKNWKVWKK